jgi:hypothetical protein
MMSLLVVVTTINNVFLFNEVVGFVILSLALGIELFVL